MDKIKVNIAIIRGNIIIDKALFEEESEAKALETAEIFLKAGHFALLGGTDVQILPEGFVIGDFFIEGEFKKAAFYALLDEHGIVTEVERRPENIAEGVFAAFGEEGFRAEPGAGPEGPDPTAGRIRLESDFPGLVGMLYKDGEFHPPPPEPTNAEIFRALAELKEEIRSMKERGQDNVGNS